MALDQIDDVDDEAEMSFLDHLEHLRWHLIRSLIAIAIVSIVALIFPELIFQKVLFAPTRTDFWTFRMLCKLSESLSLDALCIDDLPFILQSRKVTGQFMMYFTTSFVVGIIVAFPYIVWEIWRFIKPGLYSKEKKAARGAVFYVTLLFFAGISFGYFIITPVSVNFFANFKVDPSISNEFDVVNYTSTIITIVFGSGLLFQLPIAVQFLSKAGLVTPGLLRKYRRHAIVAILFIGAMLTPPEPVSQIIVAIPLFILYELGVLISARVERQNKTEELSTTE
ncbi:MAG: twin-arginine translocase subunit TatC [Cyclobacteriaceae bacterium]